MRWSAIFVLMLLTGGCATTRTVTISTKPADASLRIDGAERGRGPIVEQFVFDDTHTVHRITASRLGFKDLTLPISREFDRKELVVELKPQSRRITITIQPAAAIISVDGKRVMTEPTAVYSEELEFTVDAKNAWTTHVVTAERPGFQTASQTVSWVDRDPNYVLTLQPMRKDLVINTNPPGANVYLDSESLGVSPAHDTGRAFPVDIDTNEYIPRKLRATKPGYDPGEMQISWDNGKNEYTLDLAAKQKTVQLKTEPAGATITLDGRELPRDAAGVTTAQLKFLPINEAGELRTFSGTAVMKGAEADWYPANFTLKWDEGKSDYTIALKEILTRPVQLLTASWARDGGWEVTPKWIETIGLKNATEGSKAAPPTKMTNLPKGTSIDTLVVSPDGSQLLFTVLNGKDKDDFRSQMYVIKTDGSGGADLFSDGKSLDLTPSFTPGGDQIVFASNRAGRRMSVWQTPASGAFGTTQLTTGETNDLWPTVDSDPRPKLYYQSLIDTRSEPRLFSTALGTTFRTDMTQLGGSQPRVSPKNDVVVFTAVNEKTGKRDLYRVKSAGGAPEKLTNTLDADNYDPAWNNAGSKIAFASDRGIDVVERRRNSDIWIMDLSKPDQLVQVTANGSQDDCPAWDPSGKFIYFRSNRGGEWAIWKIAVK